MPDGSRVTVFPDGTTFARDASGYPVPAVLHADGTVQFIDRHGNVVHLGPGLLMSTMNTAGQVTTRLNGAYGSMWCLC